MEARDGLIEFRTSTVTLTSPHEKRERRPVTITTEVLEYRQCFKGIWTPWKPVKES